MNYILKDLLYSAASTLVIQNWVVPNIVELLSNTVNSSSRGSNSNETNLTDPLLKYAKQAIADIKIPYRYQTKNFYQYIQTSINQLIKAGDKNFCEEIYVLPKINTLPAIEIGHRVSSNKHKTELLGRLISVQNETATIICSSTKNILKKDISTLQRFDPHEDIRITTICNPSLFYLNYSIFAQWMGFVSPKTETIEDICSNIENSSFSGYANLTKDIHRYIKIELKKDDESQRGVFAKKLIPKQSIIGFYEGVITINPNMNYSNYTCQIGSNYNGDKICQIASNNVSNWTAFMNSSQPHLNSENIDFKYVKDKYGFHRVLFFTKCDINENQELKWNYPFNPDHPCALLDT